MDHIIYCKEGIAYVVFQPGTMRPMICGSLVNANFWELPTNTIELDIDLYSNVIELEYKSQLYLNKQLQLDIISPYSLLLRLDERDFETNTLSPVGFKITQQDLFAIGDKYLRK